MLKAKINFRYPRVGARIRIKPEGFNPAREGIYTGNDNTGKMIVNLDPNNHLPDGSPYKQDLLSILDDFEVV
jgi:hypothetical protein